MVRYVLRPSYAQIETLRAALDSIRSPAGNVQAAGNVLIITDYASQVRDMMSLAKSLDVPGNNDGIYTIPVKYADATQLAQKLNEILGIAAGGGGRRPARRRRSRRHAPPRRPRRRRRRAERRGRRGRGAVEDPRRRSHEHADRRRRARPATSASRRSSIASTSLLDTEGGTSIRVYPLENALAEGARDDAQQRAAGPQPAGQRRRRPGRPGRAGAAGAAPRPAAVGDLGAALEGQVRVIGDKPTNSLIVMSSGRDYLAIKDVIQRPRPAAPPDLHRGADPRGPARRRSSTSARSHGGLPVDDGNSLVLGGVQTPNAELARRRRRSRR